MPHANAKICGWSPPAAGPPPPPGEWGAVVQKPLPDSQLPLARGGMSRTRTEAIRIHGLQQPAVSLLIDEALKVCPTLTIDKPELSSLVRSWGMGAKERYPDIPFSGEWKNFEEFIIQKVTIFLLDFRLPRGCLTVTNENRPLSILI